MLKVEQLSAGYGAIEVLHSVSFEVPAQSIVALLGANGVGKTTMMRALLGLIPARQGTVSLEGTPIEHFSTEHRVKCGLSLVPEGRELFGSLTVRENLLVGAFTRHDHQETETQLARVLDYFPRLKTRLYALASSLSGGEGQMLAIGRALMSQPRLLLLDEPSNGLAPVVVDTVFDVIAQLRRKEHLTIIVVEQNVHKALKVADMAYIIQGGHIALYGTPDTLAHNPALQELYLGS
ncbi:MAG TPA: ABC transporter ATP-binding protein [Ktedonobacteraceae bacterium]|jgi:branched-chain amino acid transport system ATP-binding protein|nr:ABC transporter ATP-binding protein [Ktedonobacteraceae bacterium]